MAVPPDVIRRQIEASLFGPTTENGALIVHVKTWEDTPGQTGPDARKPRFMLLGVPRDGRLKLHKSKRNSNGTYSIGKTWPLEELQVIEPMRFSLTLNGRAYQWDTETPREQIDFLVGLVRSYRLFTRREPQLRRFAVEEIPNAPPPYIVPGSRTTAPISPVMPPSPGRPPRPRPAPPPSLPEPSRSAAQPSPQPPRAIRPPPGGSIRGAIGGPISREQPSGSMPEPVPIARPPRPPSPRAAPSRAQVPTVASPPLRSPSPALSNGGGDGRPMRTHSMASVASSSGSRGLGLSIPPIAIPSRNVTPDPRPSPRPSEAPARPPVVKSAPPVERDPDARRRPLTSLRAPSPALDPPERKASARPGEIAVPTPGSAPNGLLSPPLSTPAGRARSGSSAMHGLRIAPELVRTPTVERTEVEDMTLANVEEMLEGFQWKASVGRAAAAAEQIEGRLLGELQALEAASIHAIVESDDRVATVVKHLDESIAELDRLDQLITLYKTQLNVMSDDIEHIESQNKGLQVQTSNQRALLAELESLMNTINIPEADLAVLATEPFDSEAHIKRLERSAVSLYKAILSTRDSAMGGDMAAANDRVDDYARYSSNFGKRLLDYLSAAFKAEADRAVSDFVRLPEKMALAPHEPLEQALGEFCGLMLFVKEIEDQRYNQIAASYLATSSELYRKEIGDLFNHARTLIRKPTDDELEASFAPSSSASPALRSGTIKRPGGRPSDRRRTDEGPSGGEVLRRALDQIGPHVYREQQWLTDLLHLDLDSGITFAEYCDLETVFKRGAATQMAMQVGRYKDVRASMELVFGFLAQQLGELIAYILQRDQLQVFGVLVALDACADAAIGAGNDFVARVVGRQRQRCLVAVDKTTADQIKAIEQTKLSVKKRKGIAPFINIFPAFAERVESQMVDAGSLPVRAVVDKVYEQVVRTMFESLQQMAKMESEAATATADDNKDQLNAHVVLVENMHHFATSVRDLRIPALSVFVKQASELYDENLTLYVRLVLRRPLARHYDFFLGMEQLLRTTPANEVGLHSAYTKSAARRVTSSLNAKDLRKAVEPLAKRVEKHFAAGDGMPTKDAAEVQANVWRACGDEAARCATTWKALLERCYPDTQGVALEFTAADVADAFKRFKPVASA